MIGNYSEKQFQFVAQREDVIDKYEDKLGSYLIKLTGKELTEQQNLDVTKFLHTIGDMERIGDHATNLAEWVEYAQTGARSKNGHWVSPEAQATGWI